MVSPDTNPNTYGHIHRSQAVVAAGLGEMIGTRLHLTGNATEAMAIYYRQPAVELPELPEQRKEEPSTTELQEA